MQARPRRQHRRAAVACVLAVLALTGCGGEESDPATTDPDADQAVDPGVDGTDDAVDGPDAEEAPADDPGDDAQGWCADLPVADVQAALGEEIVLSGETSASSSGMGCTYRVADTEGEGLSIGEVSGANLYEIRLEQAESMGELQVQRPDLGAEAILLNNADLTILLGDGRELLVALSAFYTEAPAPDQDAIAESMVSVGELVVDRKG